MGIVDWLIVGEVFYFDCVVVVMKDSGDFFNYFKCVVMGFGIIVVE